MSGAAHRRDQIDRGTSLLPADLTAEELAAAPALESLDVLLIDDLSDAEDDAFAAAIEE